MSPLAAVFVRILFAALIAGAVAFVVRRAPFIDEPYKGWALWAILAALVVYSVIALTTYMGVRL